MGALWVLSLLLLAAYTDTTVQIYDGSTGTLVNGWQNWSWATVKIADSTIVHSPDKYSISAVMDNYEALYLEGGFDSAFSQLKTLHFWVNGGSTGGESVVLRLIVNGNAVGNAVTLDSIVGTLAPNTWVEANVPFTVFGAVDSTATPDGIWWQANSPNPQGTIYVDDIYYIEGDATPPPPPPTQTIVVNIKQNAHSISPYIFGVNFASTQQITSNGYKGNRWGGNAVTRYAYDLDSQNHASDWYFEDIPNAVSDVSKLPNGSSSDAFITSTLSGNALVLLTVPMIGYGPFDRVQRCGFSVSKYGAQASVDPYDTDCGNGMTTNNQPITGNNPADTSRVIGPDYVQGWLQHLIQVFGPTAVTNFLMDNEPGLWSSTHRDVHPSPLTYDELWNKTSNYATAIKKINASYQNWGPEFWGWCAYMYSPADGCSDGPDRQAHGDLPFLEWYIKQVGDYRTQTGLTLVDVIDVHFYPQASNVDSSDESSATAGLRLRSTRSLWDPTYVDESWINQPIYLIPRMQAWINSRAPGLKMGISEHNFGDDNIITGALAQTDALGIFANLSVHSANRWVAPAVNTQTEQAYRLYTNYDGKGSNILSSQSVLTTNTNYDVASGYGFVDTTRRILNVVIVYKSQAAGDVVVDVSTALSSGTATLYRFENQKSLYNAGQVTVSGGKVTLSSVPGWSATMLSIPY